MMASKKKPKPKRTPKPPHRPSIYTPAIGKKVCQAIMLGSTLRQIGETPGMPSKTTIVRWLADRIEDFRVQYAHAREIQAEVMADDLLDIAEDSRNDWIERENERDGGTYVELNAEALARTRTRIDTRKWLMSKRKSKTFGDSANLRHSNDPDNPMPVTTAYIAMIPSKAPPDDPGA